MTAKLVVAPEAELDLSEAYAWYETRRAGLGEDFLSSVEASIERICRQPLSYSIVHETYRRALVRRFPYCIFFDYEEAGGHDLRRISHLPRAEEMAATSPLIVIHDPAAL